MPNYFAYFMLIIWPFIGYMIVRKKDPDTATALLLIVPYLLLPVAVRINLPSTPPFDKYTISTITAFLIMFFKFKGMRFMPDRTLARVLIIFLFISPLFTYYTNRYPLVYENRTLSGLTFNDVFSMVYHNITWIYIPVMLGFSYLNNAESQKKALYVLSIAALVYSLPMLWEVRMSPRLNHQIYGYFPQSWRQQIREGGFRPVVFLGHGLKVAEFLAMGIIATAMLWKGEEDKKKKKGPWRLVYMCAVLVLCKTWSAMIYAAVALSLLWVSKSRTWLRLAAVLSIIVIAFPFLRGAGMVPTHRITDFFSQYNQDRAGSLQFRFNNEDILLEKANEKSLFGWGGWGRSRVFDDKGRDISVTDGEWIIQYGAAGWIGYAASFGLLCLPILMVLKTRLRKDETIPEYTAGICLILAINLLDLIPNSSLTPFTYLLAGSLIGYVDKVKVEAKQLKLKHRRFYASQL